MPDFWNLKSPEEFFKIAYEHLLLTPRGTEVISFTHSLQRVVARDVLSPLDLPNFNRSTMDGFAVRAADTLGVSEELPGYLSVVGEVLMGEGTDQILRHGQAMKIPTGGMLPHNADAVLMVEYTEDLNHDKIQFTRSVAPGENLVKQGDDIRAGELLLPKGHVIRAQDIGAMAGLGITSIEVNRQLEVALLSTGDELVPPEAKAVLGQIRDINTYSIGAMLEEMGCKVRRLGIVEDSFGELKEVLQRNLDCDMILVSGGSSVGVKDLTIDVVNSLGKPGVLAHGVAVKPGKPTILAAIGDTTVIGLPGHPASAWTIAAVLIKPLLQEMRGERIWQTPGGVVVHREEEGKMVLEVEAMLSRNVNSEIGREEYVPVRLTYYPEGGKITDTGEPLYVADPVTGKSSLITTLVRADGFFRIGRYAEGVKGGEIVRVRLY